MGRGRERRQKGLDRQKIGSKTLAGRPGMSDVASCLESQGCYLIPLFYLITCCFFCLVKVMKQCCSPGPGQQELSGGSSSDQSTRSDSANLLVHFNVPPANSQSTGVSLLSGISNGPFSCFPENSNIFC